MTRRRGIQRRLEDGAHATNSHRSSRWRWHSHASVESSGFQSGLRLLQLRGGYAHFPQLSRVSSGQSGPKYDLSEDYGEGRLFFLRKSSMITGKIAAQHISTCTGLLRESSPPSIFAALRLTQIPKPFAMMDVTPPAACSDDPNARCLPETAKFISRAFRGIVTKCPFGHA